jgi:hypothetical protein
MFMARKGGGATAVDYLVKCPCEFGGVSIGDATGSLGLKIDRAWLPLGKADTNFCGRRLTGTIIVGENDPNQKSFLDDGDYRIDGTFDVKRLGVTPGDYSIRLTFALSEIDVGVLSHFAKQKGRLFVEGTEDLPEKGGGDDDEEEDEDKDEE